MKFFTPILSHERHGRREWNFALEIKKTEFILHILNIDAKNDFSLLLHPLSRSLIHAALAVVKTMVLLKLTLM